MELHLQAQERVERLEVTDLSGRIIEKLPVPPASDEASTHTLTWHPKALPPGAYLLKLQTNQRSETSPLSKQ